MQRNRKQISGSQELVGRWNASDCLMGMGFLLRVMKMFWN